jgi:uncharacterized protein DUF3268
MQSTQISRVIYCTGCQCDVVARLTDGRERYPHRPDLAEIPFWKCDTCKNYVGCHWKTDTPTRPLGCIATPEILDARKKIHALLDPIWKNNRISRGQAYAYISKQLGYSYHAGEIRTMDEAREVWRVIVKLHKSLPRVETLIRNDIRRGV